MSKAYIKGIIFNIIRGSFHDGPGIRTIIYFKGCNLHCKWCHNPEGIALEPELMYYEHKCLKCGKCADLFPKCHSFENGQMILKRELCVNNYECANICPGGALIKCGELWETADLFNVIKRDKHFYDVSGGGVTFSGGECLLQPDFLKEILTLCKENGIHTCVETAFNIPWNIIEELYSLIDMFIIDIKHSDSNIHRELTGAGNELILKNIGELSRLHNNIRIRIPLIPAANDYDDNLKNIAKIINSFGDGIKEIEFLKYNDLSQNKYNAINREFYKYAKKPQGKDEMNIKTIIMKKFINKNIKIFN